ncbi:MAG: TonB-dependent receptor plug domain-containing protein, partial [Caulobacterales bacterium]
MNIRKHSERLLATSLLAGVSLFSLGGVAQAQETAAKPVEDIVVTGTRIRSPNLTAVSPVTAISSADIKQQGITRVEDLINSLPQAFAAQGAAISNGSNGTATVNLRGLGASRTLVLVDGRRLGPGVAGGSAADLNFIPSSLVKRVDIVTGGASAVYGSDALAGAVNFIMDRKFEGVLVEATTGVYQHKNDDTKSQAINKSRGFTLPAEDVTDGETTEFSIALGATTGDGKGHVVAYATYRSIEAILQGGRDFSNCTFNSGSTFSCGGSGTAFPARVGSFQVAGTGAGRQLVARAPAYVYNFGPTNYFQRPDERYTFGAFASYEVNKHFETYADLMFMNDTSVAQIAPGGIFAGTFTINCDNAYASAQQLSVMCGANAGSPTANFTGIVARRNVEGGGRQNAFEFSNYNTVVGARGEIVAGWDYDISASYYKTTRTTDTLNYFVSTRIGNALIAKRDANGAIVCQSVIAGTDTDCVPYNLFDANGVTPAMLGYLQAPGTDKGTQTQRLITASVSGDLGQAGIKSPWAEEGVGVAFGIESREDGGKYA